MTELYVPVMHGAALDRPDEADTLATALEIARALRRLGYATGVLPVEPDLTALRTIALRRPHAVFNMVEALEGDAAAAALAPAAFERLGVPYTGADAGAYSATLSKIEMKRRMAAAGIAVPALVGDGSAAVLPAAMPAELPGKAIVKSDTEHGSVGIDERSVVDAATADAEIRRREAGHGGRFFAEAFIAGREFNVAILERETGPLVLPIQEITFDGLPEGCPHIVDYDAKWIPGSAAYDGTPRRFGLEEQEPDMARRLAGTALECWTLFGLGGYARVDFRVGDDGTPFVLEVNANPCLASDAGFMAAAAAAGLSGDTVIADIVAAAARRGAGAAAGAGTGTGTGAG